MSGSATWRLIRSGPMSGAMNMALDEALFEAVAAGRSRPVLRVYRWDPATLSLGYGQRGARVADLAACRSLGLDVVRRITGGRAVLHNREVTYAVIAPRVDPLFSGGILDNYRLIAAVLQKTVASYGIPAELQSGRCPGAGRHSACFIAPSSWELVYRGRKMAGSAQKRNDRAFLQHGSIPVETDLRQLQAALGTVDADGSGLRLLEEKVGWLNRWLAKAVTVDDVEDRLVAHFAGTLGIAFHEETPTPGEWQRAKALQAKKYDNPLWNFQGLGG